MAIEFVQQSAATATTGAIIAADLIDFAGGATEVSVQMIKFGYGTDGVFNEVATGQGIPMATGPVYQIQQMATATSPVSVGTWTATGQVLTSPLASATQPVSIAAAITVGDWTATQQVLTSPLATATQPVSIATWTATGEVRVIQDLDTATDHNVTNHPFGPYDDQVKGYLDITATTVATLATSPGANNFNDLVSLFVSNHATSPQSVSIRETATATLFNPMLAADGGGFIWQPTKPTRPLFTATAWTVQTSAATGVKITAEFQTAT